MKTLPMKFVLNSSYKNMTLRERYDNMVKIDTLLGKTLIGVYGAEKRSDKIYFVCSDGSVYLMYHERDCCECVDVEDIVGNIEDLINTPLLKAEEVSISSDDSSDDSYTWTYYHLNTVKGYVTIRWYGESNGYYSESVDLIELCPPFDSDCTIDDVRHKIVKNDNEKIKRRLKGELI